LVIVPLKDAVFAMDGVLCETDPLFEELVVPVDSRVSDITDFVSAFEVEALGVIIGGGVIDCVDVLSSVGDGDGAFVGVIVGGRVMVEDGVLVGGGVIDLVVDGVCVPDANGNVALIESDRECRS
jgi:hypothetical protein